MKKLKKISWISALVMTLFLLGSSPYTASGAILPTSLNVTVLDRMGNIVEGATVVIYNNKADYLNNNNPIGTGETNKKGKISFKKLKPISYFIDVRLAKKNNDGMGAQTDTLSEGKINSINTIIE